MPLILLGLLLLIGLLTYSIVRYANSGEQTDNRPVRERYPHAFPVNSNDDHRSSDGKNTDSDSNDEEPPIDTESYYDEDSLRGDIDYMIRNISEDLRKKTRNINIDLGGIRNMIRRFDGIDDPEDDKNNTVEFPKDNIENEKRKRGIHSDN